MKISKILKGLLLVALYFLPFLAIKRIIILNFLIVLSSRFKNNISIELLFLITFLLSFFLGHFNQSPLGFILSYVYIGTFITLRNHSRPTLILGLFSSHLIISLFSGQETSPLALIINIPLLTYFSALMPLLYLYFFTYKFLPYNWIEIFAQVFIKIVRPLSKLAHLTKIDSSVFLIIAVWIILLRKEKKYLALCLLLHCNNANTPAIYYSGSSSGVQKVSGHR